MHISRVYIKNYRNFSEIDIPLEDGVNCLVGENNTGKTNLSYALRLLLDSGLSLSYRVLNEQDFHAGVDYSSPSQIVISVELSNYTDNEASAALVGLWQTDPETGKARITYRFRPTREIIAKYENEEDLPEKLTLDDYEWEIFGGGQTDPSEIEWFTRIGKFVRFADLQQFHVVFLPALRNVGQDLGHARISPLNRLLDAGAIPDDEKNELVEILRQANTSISEKPTIADAGTAIDTVFRETAGEAFNIGVRLGMSDPSFSSISRSLRLLLSNDALQDFEPFRNGLGLNNVLYISMLMEGFQRRAQNEQCAGQLLLIEEPEAHLHPQLQRVLFYGLKEKSFQTIVSTHSTHVASLSDLASIIMLTNQGNPSSRAASPVMGGLLSDHEVGDLERYLDATRSTILFARKVILVEGPSEMFIIPPLVKSVLNIDLERHGVSVVPIHGIHFDTYAKLFNQFGMPKKCAIVADGDLAPSDVGESDEDIQIILPDLDSQRTEFVRDFRCQTTFERALTLEGTLNMLAAGIQELGAPRVAEHLRQALEDFQSGAQKTDEKNEELGILKERVLRTANRFGKARFAQVVSKYAHLATSLPQYISDAVAWLEL